MNDGDLRERQEESILYNAKLAKAGDGQFTWPV
jgi:hypothetical protein